MNGLAESIAILIVLSGTTTYYVAVIGRLVWVALRTGRLQSRGVTYDRSTQPKRYWFLIVGATALGLVLVFATFLYLVEFIRRWIA